MSRLIYLIAFTPSFDRMRGFYENVLGLRVRHEAPRWVEFHTSGARLALLAIPPDKRGLQLRFEAPDIDRMCAEMARRGVPFEHGVEHYDWGRFNEFWDPEGRLIALLQPSRPFESSQGLALSTVILNTNEFSRLASFYREHVGWPVAADEHPHWIEFDTGDTRVAVHARTERPDSPLHATPRVSFAFEVEDLDAFATELRARGVQFATAPNEEEFGVFAELLDPDGNVVVLRESLPPAPIEEQLAEPFEDDSAPSHAAFRKPVSKGPTQSKPAGAANGVRKKGAAKKKATKAKRKPQAAAKPRTGAARAKGAAKARRTKEKARPRPALGRLRKAERKTQVAKKRSVAGTSKAKPVKRAVSKRGGKRR